MHSECVSCFDELPTGEVTSLSCKHGYCRTCFVKLITTAMQNESSFPPKCCLTEIKLPAILHALNTEQREMYKLKAAEWAQPAGSRWYCPKPECAKWIAPSGILRSRSSGQRCPHCRTKICGMCRGLAHDQVTECPQDFGLNATLDAAEREGWQRCYRCRSLVEKTIGCRHITCKCKAEFCYTCGSRWRTCQCTEVDEVRRAAQLQERRSAMDAEARREEQEIARAIAEVEALELREAEDRRLAEQRREEERRREEEELRRLEELRLQELEKRRKEEEEAERNRIEAIKFSIEGRGTFLVTILKELVQIQQLALISRHESSEQEARTTLEEQQNMNRAEYEFFKQKMLANMKKRSKSLKDKHDTEVKIMTARHQNNEDSMFLDIQLFYKGRPNREARERTMFESLARSHKEELAALTERHQYESYILKRNAAIEGKGLQHGYSSKEQSAKSKLESQKATLERKIAFERKWFEVVTNRRFELLQELHLDQLRTMGESTLLKNWEVLPSLKAVAEVEADAEVKSERQGGTSSNVEDDLDALIGHIAAFSPSQETEALQLSSPPLRNPARRNQTSLSPEKHLPDTAEKVVDPRPPQTSQPTISVSPVDTSSATEDSSQAIWETQSRLSSRSATPTTSASSSSSNTPPSSESSISRTSLTLPRTQKRMAKGTEKKESRWSLGKWFGREEKVVDEKTMREMLMGAVGDAR